MTPRLCKRSLRFVSTVALIASGICFALTAVHAQTAKEIIPADSEMGKADPKLQRILLSALEGDSKIEKGSFHMSSVASDPAPADVTAKCGKVALSFHGLAEGEGSKGDFNVFGAIPGQCKYIGVWVYRTADSNVKNFGFQITDAEGEVLWAKIDDVWDGWKWCEINLETAKFEQAFAQQDKNHALDLPIKRVNLAWFAQNAGPSSLVVDGIVAITDISASPIVPDFTGGLADQIVVENAQPFAAPYLLTNYADKPVTVNLDILLQRDSSLAAPPAPDAVYGTDHALGTKSWTELDGQKIEEGSLTDGKDWTGERLPYKKGAYTEAFQFIDLGRERNVTRMVSWGGDANWMWNIDVAASADGVTYKDVPDLQKIDFHHKWGSNIPFPESAPFKARFIRLRYHKGGEQVDCLAMPNGISVYDGIADETWDIPKVGETIYQDKRKVEIPAHSFSLVTIATPSPLSAGAYTVDFRVDTATTKFLDQASVFVMPPVLKTISDASMFGLNASTQDLAPINRRLGVGWVRFENMKWPMVSPAPDAFAYDGSVKPWVVKEDAIMQAYAEQGFSILPFLFMTPVYASSATASIPEGRRMSYPPKDDAAMADFVFQTVARYGSQKHPAEELKTEDKKSGLNQIHVFEIWNEENLNAPSWGPWVSTMDRYYEMFRPAAEAVKKADPTAKVTNGGFAGIEVSLADTLRTHKYPDGKTPLDFVDILNVHYYSGRIPPEIAAVNTNEDRSGNTKGEETYEATLRALVAWRDANKKTMPIWLTETGYDTGGPYGISERLQAARLPRVIMTTLGQGIDKVFVYREAGSTPSQHAAEGVLRNDRSFKPAWFTYATLIRELDGAKLLREIPVGDPNIRLYVWTRGEEKILTAWSVEGAATLDIKLGKCTVTDAFGAKQERDISDGLKLDDFPIYITKVANLDTILQPLLKKADEAKAVADKENEKLAKLKAYLYDFGTKTTNQTLTVGVPRPFTAVSAENVFDETTGFGFSKAALKDETAGWIKNPLSATACRLTQDISFSFKADAGQYHLRLEISPLDAKSTVTVSGGTEEFTAEVTKDNPVVEGDITVPEGGSLLTVSGTGYTLIRWLTLVQKDVPAPPPSPKK